MELKGDRAITSVRGRDGAGPDVVGIGVGVLIGLMVPAEFPYIIVALVGDGFNAIVGMMDGQVEDVCAVAVEVVSST